MRKKYKASLIFSIVFWLLILMGLLLFGYSLGKVSINKYAILRHYYSSWISNQTYISGLYHVGVGYYFVEFPSSKVYLNDIQLNVTNKDMNVMQITYSLVFRIVFSEVYNLYQSLSLSYQKAIIASINSILSTYFIGKSQEESRVTLQPDIIASIIANYGTKIPILKNSTVIEAFWLNQINFLNLENQYNLAYLDTGALSQAYSTIQIQIMKTTMQIQTIQNLLSTLKTQLVLVSQSAITNAGSVIQNSAEFKKARNQLLFSNRTQAAQILEYYTMPSFTLI